MGLVMQPVFFNIEEHHRICGCPTSRHLIDCGLNAERSDRVSESLMDVSPSSIVGHGQASTLVEADGCGIIPVPAPRRIVRLNRVHNDNEGGFQGVPIDDNGLPILPPVNVNAPAVAAPSHPFTANEDASMTMGIPDRVDYSMSNAWFPGKLGGVSFMKRKAYQDDMWGNKRRRRDEVVFGVDFERVRLDEKGICESISPTGSMMSSEASSTRQAPPTIAPTTAQGTASGSSSTTTGYVYETYDPTKESSHDPSKCHRCGEWDAARRRERKKARRDAQKGAETVLETYMQDFSGKSGKGQGGKMEKLDVTGFGFDVESVLSNAGVDVQSDVGMHPVSPPTSFEATDSDEEEDSDDEDDRHIEILGDDCPEGQPAVYDSNGNLVAEATRRVFDRERVGVEGGCCGGVRDIVLTGEVRDNFSTLHCRDMYTKPSSFI